MFSSSLLRMLGYALYIFLLNFFLPKMFKNKFCYKGFACIVKISLKTPNFKETWKHKTSVEDSVFWSIIKIWNWEYNIHFKYALFSAMIAECMCQLLVINQWCISHSCLKDLVLKIPIFIFEKCKHSTPSSRNGQVRNHLFTIMNEFMQLICFDIYDKSKTHAF